MKDPIYTRIALAGESDSGKTFSASILARELAAPNKTLIVDTENRAKLYRTKFPGFQIATVEMPFDPEKLTTLLAKSKAEGIELVIVDSASFFWDRVNDIATEMESTVKDKRRIWGKLTPRWDAFKNAINNAQLHVITTWKMKDVVPANAGDKPTRRVVVRGGGKALKFDYHLVFMMNEQRQAVMIKDNYDLFSDWKEPKQITSDTGKAIAKWLKEN